MSRLLASVILPLRLIILAGEIATSAADSRNLQAVFESSGYESVELRRTGENHLFHFGKLNGRRRSMLVDTGWSFTTVSTNAARQLDTPPGDATALRHPFFPTNQDVSEVLINRLTLGRVELTDQPALVQHMLVNGQRAPYDVVLGCDFLMRNFGVLDCASRRLYLRRAALAELTQKKFDEAMRRSGFDAIPLHRKTPLALTCLARVNGETLEMLVDSAAPWSCVDVRQSERLRLKSAASAARITGVGRTGTRGIGAAPIQSFQVGDTDLKITTLAVFDLADWGFAGPDTALSEVQGILGSDALNAASAVIDCAGLKMWVKPANRKR